MKHTKEFFGVLFSILISVFLVFVGVYATTTISDDITVGDDLVVSGLASISETLRVPTIYGNTDSGLYLRIGDQALTSHSLDAQDDLLVTGDLEVDGTAYFDGVASISDTNGLVIGGGIKLFGGTASPGLDCAAGSWYFRAGQVVSESLYYCETANEWDPVGI